MIVKDPLKHSSYRRGHKQINMWESTKSDQHSWISWILLLFFKLSFTKINRNLELIWIYYTQSNGHTQINAIRYARLHDDLSKGLFHHSWRRNMPSSISPKKKKPQFRRHLSSQKSTRHVIATNGKLLNKLTNIVKKPNINLVKGSQKIIFYPHIENSSYTIIQCNYSRRLNLTNHLLSSGQIFIHFIYLGTSLAKTIAILFILEKTQFDRTKPSTSICFFYLYLL